MTSGPCQETSGFLFKHPCGRNAEQICADCDKAICNRHTKHVGKAQLCVHCAKLELEKESGGRSSSRRRGRDRQGAYGAYSDDPYFYGYSYYDGYGSYRRGHWGHSHYYDDNDPVDFTEADGESFQVEADEGFEQDMGGS